MPKRCLKLSYTERGRNVRLYSVVLAGGPNCVSLIIISAQRGDSFCSKISQEVIFLHRFPPGLN